MAGCWQGKVDECQFRVRTLPVDTWSHLKMGVWFQGLEILENLSFFLLSLWNVCKNEIKICIRFFQSFISICFSTIWQHLQVLGNGLADWWVLEVHIVGSVQTLLIFFCLSYQCSTLKDIFLNIVCGDAFRFFSSICSTQLEQIGFFSEKFVDVT